MTKAPIKERRVAEAASLRHLFQEQWSQIVDFWEAHEQQRRAKREEEERLRAAVETIVEHTDARMRALGGYRKSLRESAHRILNHIQTITAQVPGPLLISPDRFASDQRINAFFTNKQEVTEVLGQSQTLRDFFNGQHASRDSAFLILSMAHREKHVFGVGGDGDLIQRETLQTTVSFSEHRVLFPCPDETSLRSALARYLFDNLVTFVSQAMVKWRHSSAVTPIQTALQPCDPKSYLEELTRRLEAPKELLRIEQNTLHISKMGVKLDPHSTQPANDVRLDEVELGDLPPRVVVLAEYPRAAMTEPPSLSLG